MAERKTFLFFCGWAEVLEDFSPEDRCAVYDAIITYAEKGSLPDTLRPELMMAFKFIKKDIDEMQGKYEITCQKRREAAHKRWQKMQKHANAAIDAIDANGCNSMQMLQKQDLHYNYKHEHEHKHKHKHEHEHEHERKNIDKSNSSSSNNINNNSRTGANEEEEEKAEGLKEKIADLKKSEIWKESVAMRFKMIPTDIDPWLDEFYSDAIARGWNVGNEKSLFVSWLGEQINKSGTTGSNSGRNYGLGPEEFIDEHGNRRFSIHNEQVVPMDAPPRPSVAHYWNPVSGFWENFI